MKADARSFCLLVEHLTPRGGWGAFCWTGGVLALVFEHGRGLSLLLARLAGW